MDFFKKSIVFLDEAQTYLATEFCDFFLNVEDIILGFHSFEITAGKNGKKKHK